MTYTLKLTKVAQSDIVKHKKAGDTQLLRKLQKLLKELIEHAQVRVNRNCSNTIYVDCIHAESVVNID